MQETLVQSLGGEDPLEKETATHSSILAWRDPWTEKPGGLQSTGSQRVGHEWSDLASTLFGFLTGESVCGLWTSVASHSSSCLGYMKWEFISCSDWTVLTKSLTGRVILGKPSTFSQKRQDGRWCPALSNFQPGRGSSVAKDMVGEGKRDGACQLWIFISHRPSPLSFIASPPTLSWAALHVCLVATSLGNERTAAHFLQASTLSKDL